MRDAGLAGRDSCTECIEGSVEFLSGVKPRDDAGRLEARLVDKSLLTPCSCRGSCAKAWRAVDTLCSAGWSVCIAFGLLGAGSRGRRNPKRSISALLYGSWLVLGRVTAEDAGLGLENEISGRCGRCDKLGDDLGVQRGDVAFCVSMTPRSSSMVANAGCVAPSGSYIDLTRDEKLFSSADRMRDVLRILGEPSTDLPCSTAAATGG